MKHRFQHICYDPIKLLDGCNKLSTFISRINKQAEEDRGMGWTSDEYKGFAFEALIEVLITSSPIDKRINIKNYRPHSNKIDGRDMGIDGYGESHNGNLHTVQIKFRSDCTSDLTTKDGISNFVAHTRVHPVYKDADMTVFTTAKDLHVVIAEEMYNGQVRTVGYNDLRGLLDNNMAFWDTFRAQMQKQNS
jgi:hypothetical protein